MSTKPDGTPWTFRPCDGIPGTVASQYPPSVGSSDTSTTRSSYEYEHRPDLSWAIRTPGYASLREYRLRERWEIWEAIQSVSTLGADTEDSDSPELHRTETGSDRPLISAALSRPNGPIEKVFTCLCNFFSRSASPASTLPKPYAPFTSSNSADCIHEWPATTHGSATLPSFSRRNTGRIAVQKRQEKKSSFLSPFNALYSRFFKAKPFPLDSRQTSPSDFPCHSQRSSEGFALAPLEPATLPRDVTSGSSSFSSIGFSLGSEQSLAISCSKA
ncbi:hypothetical protein jhhlp_007206 [Lomentospora prolificans]|uniref:Uncharacterized protein n=1 Tax=Lomentospora prolificans TaxID=41688 RepID=A0A2N3N202_9PEZI|nr:hypothetical protein jhhlp_007206 [Lomentospora prolificans]